MRKISIFGATGSIGQSTIDLIAREPERFQTVALTGGANVAQLAADARRLKAEIAVIADERLLPDLQAALAGSGIEAAGGYEAVVEAASRPVDWGMSAIVGSAGLRPGLKLLEQGATLALANKESMVAAGPLVLAAAKASGARVLPVDSEHSAIFQCLHDADLKTVNRVIITASGGPFRGWSRAQMASVTPAMASKHPNWAMGQRITIDSASLFNKALEVIEAKEYFGIPPEQIEVLVHPQSLIHSLVGYVDGGLLAHVGPPDMRHAIGYALNWPERAPLPVARLDLAIIGTMQFEAPDEEAFPPLRLAREVMAAGGLSGAVFNAAKERALDLFLAEKLSFLGMAETVEQVLTQLWAEGIGRAEVSLTSVLEADARARVLAEEIAGRLTE